MNYFSQFDKTSKADQLLLHLHRGRRCQENHVKNNEKLSVVFYTDAYLHVCCNMLTVFVLNIQ